MQFASPVGTKSVPTGDMGQCTLSMEIDEPTDDHHNASSLHTSEPYVARGKVPHDKGETGASKVGAMAHSPVAQEKTTGSEKKRKSDAVHSGKQKKRRKNNTLIIPEAQGNFAELGWVCSAKGLIPPLDIRGFREPIDCKYGWGG